MSKIEEMLKNEKVEWKKLGEVCKRQRGITITAGKMKELTKTNGQVKVFAGGKTYAYLDFDDVGRENIIETPSIIVKSRGNIDFEFCNESFTHKNELWSYSSSNIEKINIKFIYYYIKSNLKYFRDCSIGGKLPQISVGVTDNFFVPIPSIKTQEKIVKTLDKFTEYVTELQAELQAELQYRTNQYEYYRNMLLSEEYLNKLSKKLLDVFGGENRLYCSNLEYMRELIEVKLETIVKIKNGKDWKKLGKGNIPVYGSGGNMDIYVDKYSYNKPSVLIPRKGSIENVFYLEEPFWNVDTIFYTEIDESKIIPRYLYYFISNYDIKSLSTDSTRPSLTQEALNRIVVQLPPLSLQNKIVEILDKFQAIRSETKGLLAKEIEERQKQYEYYREKLLTFDVESGTHARTHATNR